jgi:outer membrane lipoprotein-sorting protein
MQLLFVPVLAVVLSQAGDDPAARQQAMEEKIGKAKSVRVSFEARAETPAGDITLSGFLAVAGDRGRAEIEFGFAGKTTKAVSVADGTKTVSVQDGKTREKKDPRETRPFVTMTLARSGVAALALASRPSTTDDKEKKEQFQDRIKVSDFKQLRTEKVGGRAAVVIGYSLTVRGQKPMSATVWLDAQTNLPLKRVVRMEDKNGVYTITETYSNLTLDAELDPKLFEFPK